ncbi:hypothetical protein D8M09_17540 [Enterobacter sp. R1(2018)]|nr:hypothetical protein [Enterobacter sp. R1(2018)]RKQ38407.1 hypothetical protein D8M09_17540 [Enterobacter sp. R1(2018)]
MMNFREYKSRRPNRILYDTITIYSSTFGYIRLVKDQIFPKTFAGQIYQPCRMEIVESQQSSTPVISSTVKFSRLASEFKQQLKQWKAFSRIEPIQFTYQRFDSADVNTPLKPWTLYVSDLTMDANDVTVSLTIKNPLNANIGLLYNVEEFPGLQNA